MRNDQFLKNFDTPDSDTYDKGVEIGGVVWATRNVGEPGKFAAASESSGMFYQWNIHIGWSASDPIQSFPSGATWSLGSTATKWEAGNNPCPAGWQVPTKAQFEALIASGVSAWEPLFGVNGRKFGNSTHFIFLPAANALSTTGSNDYVSGYGDYFAKEQLNINTGFACYLVVPYQCPFTTEM